MFHQVEVGRLRIFFGLALPPDLQETLGRWQRGYGDLGGWSQPDGLHLTLAFLGERSQESLPAVEAVATTVAGRHGACRLHTSTLGGFPGGKATRLLFLGLEPSAALDALVADLRGALVATGETFDPKPFHPHLTLARFRRAHPLATFTPPPPTGFAVEQLVLFESRPQGCYTPLRSWTLRKV